MRYTHYHEVHAYEIILPNLISRGFVSYKRMSYRLSDFQIGVFEKSLSDTGENSSQAEAMGRVPATNWGRLEFEMP